MSTILINNNERSLRKGGKGSAAINQHKSWLPIR